MCFGTHTEADFHRQPEAGQLIAEGIVPSDA